MSSLLWKKQNHLSATLSAVMKFFGFSATILVLTCLVAAYDAEIEDSVNTFRNLPKRPSPYEFVEIHGLYMQATVGDVITARPGMMDITGRAKWDAWNRLKGTSKEEAKTRHIALVQQLAKKYGN